MAIDPYVILATIQRGGTFSRVLRTLRLGFNQLRYE